MNHRNLHFSKSFSRSSCRQFDIQYCTDIEKEVVDNLEDFEAFDDEIADVDREQQVSEFVETPSFVTLFTGSQVEPLYFAQVAEKGAAESILIGDYCHVILPGERYFRGHYLKLFQSRNVSMKLYPLLHICPLKKSTKPMLT